MSHLRSNSTDGPRTTMPFRPAGVLGYETPYPIPIEHEDAWMVQELKAGVLGSEQGRIQCAETLDQPRHWQQ